MSADTGLGALSDEQSDLVRDMLTEEERDPSQVSEAAFQVIAFCNIYGGQSGTNQDSPINAIPGLAS